jgi:hypothetical protein
VIAHLVLGDAPQPAAKAIGGLIAVKAVEAAGDGPEDLLDDVTGIRILKARGAAPAIDEGAVELAKPFPGRRLARSRSRSVVEVEPGASGIREVNDLMVHPRTEITAGSIARHDTTPLERCKLGEFYHKGTAGNRGTVLVKSCQQRGCRENGPLLVVNAHWRYADP